MLADLRAERQQLSVGNSRVAAIAGRLDRATSSYAIRLEFAREASEVRKLSELRRHSAERVNGPVQPNGPVQSNGAGQENGSAHGTK